jgi:AcrR family transcriptional regulator
MTPGDSEATRRTILDTTRRLLKESGEGAGMARIAAAAGYSRQAIYRHFGSRAGLLKAVLADIDERAGAGAAVEGVLAADDAEAVLDALVAWWADYVAGFIGVARSVHAASAADAELAAAWEDRMEALMEVCRLVVGRCAREGRLRAGLGRPAAAEILWALLSIPLWDQLRVDRGWSRNKYRRRIGLAARATLLEPQSPEG